MVPHSCLHLQGSCHLPVMKAKMPTCRIEADGDQDLGTGEVAEASSRLTPDMEGVAPTAQNSRRQQQEVGTSSGRMSESEPSTFLHVSLQVSKWTSMSG